MDYKIIWTQPALDDLEEIVLRLLQHNADYAEESGQNIVNKIELLQEFPFLGVSYRYADEKNVREISCPPHRIFYRVRPVTAQVEILSIWHSARREPHELAP